MSHNLFVYCLVRNFESYIEKHYTAAHRSAQRQASRQKMGSTRCVRLCIRHTVGMERFNCSIRVNGVVDGRPCFWMTFKLGTDTPPPNTDCTQRVVSSATSAESATADLTLLSSKSKVLQTKRRRSSTLERCVAIMENL